MLIESISVFVRDLSNFLWGWPLVLFVMFAGVVFTLALGFAQFRYFFKAWKYVFTPEKGTQTETHITPVQAFLGILNSSIGNGSLAGMATAVLYGGPGAAFWIFVLGFLYMAIRYGEVYLSYVFQEEGSVGAMRGGPMVYLKKLPAGKILAAIFATFMFIVSINNANSMQCNSICVGMIRLTGLSKYVIALALVGFLLYIMFGGAKRIIKFSEAIVPIKVGLFFISTFMVLAYNYAGLIEAFKIIILSALKPSALAGGAIGFSVQQAITYGMSISMNSTEVGLGSAGIFFGATKTKNPVRNSLMSMISCFVSSHLVGFTVILALVVTGAWKVPGLESTQMTMAAYGSLFGKLGGDLIVAFLSVTFGLGVLVSYAYVGRECWLYLTKGRFEGVYTVIYVLVAFLGAIAKVELIWNLILIANPVLILLNLAAMLYLVPVVRKGYVDWVKARK